MLVFPSTLEPLLKRLPFSLVLGALVTASVLAMQSAPAATTSDFRLRADMLPASCDLTISNNGIVDFGVIMAASLSDTGFTRVGKRDITLSITCDAAAKVAISASDGRPGTIPAGIGKFLYANQDDASVFGAGNVDGHNIGGYLVYHNADGTADGNCQTMLVGPSALSKGLVDACCKDCNLASTANSPRWTAVEFWAGDAGNGAGRGLYNKAPSRYLMRLIS